MTLNELQEDSNQPLRINWFRQMLVEARGERMFPVFRARERRNRNGRDGGETLLLFKAAQPLQEPVSVLIGHADVRDDGVRAPRAQCLAASGTSVRYGSEPPPRTA